MNPQIKQKWVDALRSGDYQQTKGRLRKEDKFCCLGVLCDLYGKEHNVEWDLVEDEDHNYYMFQNHPATLPLPVVEWAGVGSPNPSIGGISFTLVEFNDNGSTFIEIADLIEEHL
jgi:hypothetical protein